MGIVHLCLHVNTQYSSNVSVSLPSDHYYAPLSLDVKCQAGTVSTDGKLTASAYRSHPCCVVIASRQIQTSTEANTKGEGRGKWEAEISEINGEHWTDFSTLK